MQPIVNVTIPLNLCEVQIFYIFTYLDIFVYVKHLDVKF